MILDKTITLNTAGLALRWIRVRLLDLPLQFNSFLFLALALTQTLVL